VVSTVVTDDSTPTEFIAELREAEIEVIVA